MCVCVCALESECERGFGCLYQSKVGEGQGGCNMYCPASVGQAGAVSASLEPRSSSPRFFCAGLEKNRGVRPGSISHVMRAADVTAIM